MFKVGTIKELLRYPVKGMGGEQLQTSHLGKLGLEGDRVWCVRDVLRQEIQSCKFRPELLTCSAKLRENNTSETDKNVDIVLPNGRLTGSDAPMVNQLISELVGHESTLEMFSSSEGLDYYRRYKADDHTWLDELKATFEREHGEPLPDLDNLSQSVQDFVTLPESFFLVSPLHFVTTASLDYMKKYKQNSDWATERFRPNIVIETKPHLQGLIEQSWIGKKIIIGDASIDCNASTPRCGAVTKQQQALVVDNQILRTIVQKAEQNLGGYGDILVPGFLSVGDDVFICDAY